MKRIVDNVWHMRSSSAVVEMGALGNLQLRPFGILPEDREVDFNSPRPSLETEILRRCTRDTEGKTPPNDALWAMEIGDRTQCLLVIAGLGAWGEELTLDLRCHNPDCAEEMQIDLSLADIARLQHRDQVDRLIHVDIGSERFSFRRPTGQDQLTWLNQAFADEHAAVSAMARTLVVDADAERFAQLAGQGMDWRHPLSEALEVVDPLVNFSIDTPCPYCGTEASYLVDLGAMALQRLQKAQDRLLESIHALAFRYHWSEDEILALPPWRRARYLAFIEREAAR